MEGFVLTLRKKRRVKWTDFISDTLQLLLGKDVTGCDIDFLIAKMRRLRLFQINCSKVFKRDAEVLRDDSFLKETVKVMDALKGYYEFAIGTFNGNQI